MKQKLELALSVSTYDGHPPKRALGARVTDDTCVIGRDASCQLALPDPEREVSGQHVLIYRQDDGFAVVDVSRNGTFLNGAEEPLDPSQPVDLHHGDRLTIGRYVVEVGFVRRAEALARTAQASESSPPPDAQPGRSSVPDILGDIDGDSTPPAIETPSQDAARRQAPPEGAQADRAMAPRMPQSSVEPSVPDPADAPTILVPVAEWPSGGAPKTLAGERTAAPQPPVSGAHPAVEDRASGQAASATTRAVAADEPKQSLCPEPAPIGVAVGDGGSSPAAGDAAGDDREPSGRAGTEAAAAQSEARHDPTAPEARAEAPASDVPEPGRPPDPDRTIEGPGHAAKLGGAPVLDDATRIRLPVDEPPPRPLSPARSSQVEAFLAGLEAGHPDEIGDADRLMRTSGRLLRALTQGLVAMTMAKGRLDGELRRGISPAPPGAVNPFRFCIDIEETLARVLWRPGRGDLDPSVAARQAFDDLEVHQAALTAGFHAVLKALLARLEPHAIEQEVEGQVGLSQLRPNARKAKCWECYTKSFEEIADDLADDFPKLMGDAFDRAYDDQVERLREAK